MNLKELFYLVIDYVMSRIQPPLDRFEQRLCLIIGPRVQTVSPIFGRAKARLSPVAGHMAFRVSVSVLLVVVGISSVIGYGIWAYRQQHPLSMMSEEDRYETAHWTISSPLARDGITKWQINFKRDDDSPLSCYIEFFPSYGRMGVSIERRDMPRCTYQQFRVDKEGPDQYGKYVSKLGEWTYDDCTRCCERRPSENHLDLFHQVSPYFQELPEEVKEDLRPYLKTIGHEL